VSRIVSYFRPIYVSDAGTNLYGNLMSISAVPFYNENSFEEIRYFDYSMNMHKMPLRSSERQVIIILILLSINNFFQSSATDSERDHLRTFLLAMGLPPLRDLDISNTTKKFNELTLDTQSPFSFHGEQGKKSFYF
jgi:hypothetical protein